MISTSLKLKQVPSWSYDLCKTFKKKQVLLLEGTLAAGKTELVKHIVKNLGGQVVASPTFGLIHHYDVNEGRKVYHVDLYRIESDWELEATGFWDLFSENEGLIIIEWSDKLDSAELPLHWDILKISIEKPREDDFRNYYLEKLNSL